jgi:hypothetical protein
VQVRDAELASRASGLQVTTSSLGNNRVRVLISDFGENDINPGDNEILRLSLSGATNGDVVRVENVVLTERDLTEHCPDAFDLDLDATSVINLPAGEVRLWVENGQLFIESLHNDSAQLVLPNGIATQLSVTAGLNTYTIPYRGVVMVHVAGKTAKVIVK